MNPAVVRILLILMISIAISGCAGQYFRPSVEAAAPIRHALAAWPYEEYWTGVVFNGDKIGFTHLRLIPPQAQGEFQVESRAALRFTFLGVGKEITLQGSERLAPDLALRSFHYRQGMDGAVLEQSGRVVDGVVEVAVRSGDSMTKARHVAGEPVYSSNALVLYPPLHGLEVGRRYRYLIYDGETRQLARVEQAVLAFEESTLFDGPAFKVQTEVLGHSVTTWFDTSGRPVFELALGGAFISALEPKAQAQRYLAEAALNKREVLLEFSRVRTDRPIPEPRQVKRLSLVLLGIPPGHRLPSDGSQRCIEAGEEVRCSLGEGVAGVAVAAVDDYLGSSLTVPAAHPRIRRLARDIAGDEAEPGHQVRRLLLWLATNLRQEGGDVFSALDVLDRGGAECQGHSYLYAALARSLGIPTKVVNGLVYSEVGPGFLYHTWAESWLAGRWHPVDPTFGQLPADATHLKLVEGEGPGELATLVPLIGRLRVRILAID